MHCHYDGLQAATSVRVCLDDPKEMKIWAGHFGVPFAVLRAAVAAVGSEVSDVRAQLAEWRRTEKIR